MATVAYNPLAPPVQNGISQMMSGPSGFYDEAFDYLYTVQLTASQVLTDQYVAIYTFADFAWRAVTVTVATGLFSVQFSDGQGYYLSNAPINSPNLIGTPSDPFCWPGEILLPAAGRLYINLTDLSAATNNIQLVFRGAHRFRQGGLGRG